VDVDADYLADFSNYRPFTNSLVRNSEPILVLNCCARKRDNAPGPGRDGTDLDGHRPSA
jgi:hypothetical protein